MIQRHAKALLSPLGIRNAATRRDRQIIKELIPQLKQQTLSKMLTRTYDEETLNRMVYEVFKITVRNLREQDQTARLRKDSTNRCERDAITLSEASRTQSQRSDHRRPSVAEPAHSNDERAARLHGTKNPDRRLDETIVSWNLVLIVKKTESRRMCAVSLKQLWDDTLSVTPSIARAKYEKLIGFVQFEIPGYQRNEHTLIASVEHGDMRIHDGDMRVHDDGSLHTAMLVQL